MKPIRRLTLIGVMMVTAQILIAVMVVQWLAMQYREEQKVLSGDITRAWEDANRQMLDSMLMKHYINPALDTAGQHRVSFKFDRFTRMPRPGNGKKIFVHISDSINDSVTMRKEAFTAKEIVLQGVKLFVDVQENDSVNFKHTMGMEMPDTSVLRSAFHNQLQLIYPDIKVSWDTNKSTKTDTVGNKHKVEYSYTIQVNNKNIKVDVKGYPKILFTKMLPGGLFGFLLIMLTSAAFIISFRSLRSQMLLNTQRNDFIRNMSHELRTPVSTVKVALEALSNFDRSSEKDVMQEYLHMAISETGRLEMLINRVTDLMTAGDLQILLKQEDISHLVEEVVTLMKPRVEAEDASLKVIHSTGHVVAEVDSLHLKGVLINLIDNSLKYSDPPAKIEITTELVGEHIIITVGDRGQGIPPEYTGRIFEKFFRVPKGDVHNIKGYGLGLSYAEMVMKQHGGTTSVSATGRWGEPCL
jgi:nitrogen-specific signal transduction histidine kinase